MALSFEIIAVSVLILSLHGITAAFNPDYGSGSYDLELYNICSDELFQRIDNCPSSVIIKLLETGANIDELINILSLTSLEDAFGKVKSLAECVVNQISDVSPDCRPVVFGAAFGGPTYDQVWKFARNLYNYNIKTWTPAVIEEVSQSGSCFLQNDVMLRAQLCLWNTENFCTGFQKLGSCLVDVVSTNEFCSPGLLELIYNQINNIQDIVDEACQENNGTYE